jgi:hypothetical protein
MDIAVPQVTQHVSQNFIKFTVKQTKQILLEFYQAVVTPIISIVRILTANERTNEKNRAASYDVFSELKEDKKTS